MSAPNHNLNFITPATATASAVSTEFTSSLYYETQIREKDDEILFLKRTNEGLLAEIKDFQDYAQYCDTVHSELSKTHTDLQKAYNKLQIVAEKDSSNLHLKLNEMNLKMGEMSASRGKFVQSQARSRKTYHDLCPAQKSVVHKDVRENLVPELDLAFKKRKLEVSQVVLRDSQGNNSTVKIDAQPKHTFDQLSPTELETVSAMSDLKSIHRTSNAAYAANRRLINDLPPLAHLRQHDEALMAKMPPITAAPGRAGGFTLIRTEIKSQIEYLGRKGCLDLEEPVVVKTGIDATKMTHSETACVYSVESAQCLRPR